MQENKIHFNDYFYYDETSPSCLRWKVTAYSGRNLSIVERNIGDVAGGKSAEYWVVSAWNTQYKVHRVIFEMHNGKVSDDLVVDHIDGNTLNNSLSNLRATTQTKNTRNSCKQSNNVSGITGVSWANKEHPRKGVFSTYAVASWNNLENKKMSKAFPVKKFGLLPAFHLACIYRKKMIDVLNELGAEYSERHGR